MDNDNVIKITNENAKLPVDSKDNMALSPNYDIDKVYIWEYELCKGSEWNDFLEIVNKLGEKNSELKKQLEASETQNKRVLEKLELITKSNQDLEKQLGEKEKEIEKYQNALVLDYSTREWRKIGKMQQENHQFKQAYRELRKEYGKRLEENKQAHKLNDGLGERIKGLGKQLKSQPAEIIKTIRNFCGIKYCDKEVSLKQVKDFLDDLLQEYQKEGT